MHADLFSANVDFHDDLVRNIPGIRKQRNLFDDLSTDAADWDIAAAAARADRTATTAALISRPFELGTAISYSFESAHWQATRFSDGTAYGVWYGALDVETTVYETAWHWYRFVLDSYASEDREIVAERRVLDVRCDALLIDLRDKRAAHPDLTSRRSYAFTHKIGRYIHEQGLNGLLVPSARCYGINAAIFKQERLSNARDRGFLTYRLNALHDSLVVQRASGRKWLELAPSTLG
ncbi:MAG: RES family NAD+ phosphorylase [Burkholderiales bacterium]|nr:RES family NAD+ phosphorylase [Burkholderiales bacterium]